jgi:uncharacterized protein involved in outer membrane biogenesis
MADLSYLEALMNRWTKNILIAAGALAVLALLAATVLPLLIRNRAVRILGEATGRTVRIEKLTVNPLTLRATVRGFAIEEAGGGPFFSLAALTASVSPSSLYRRALVLSELAIEAPSLRVVRAGAERFNFTDILERQEAKPKEPKPEKTKPEKTKPEEPKPEEPKPAGRFPFVLNNVKLTGGSLELEDRAVAGGRTQTLKNLEIDLPCLSSLPAEADREVELRVSLVFNGAPLSLTAKIKPVIGDLTASLQLILRQLSLPPLSGYAPQAPPVELASGDLSLDPERRFRQPADQRPGVHVRAFARLASPGRLW